MRVKIGNKIIWFSTAIQPGGTDDHIYLGHAYDGEHYVIDCKSTDLATAFLNDLLQYGFADVSNFFGNSFDYSNDIDWNEMSFKSAVARIGRR